MKFSLNPFAWFKGKSSDEVIRLPMFGGSIRSAGVDVSPLTAMQQATVYSCARVISETIGQLPLKLYKYDSNGKRSIVKRNTRNYKIFTQQINEFQTAQEFIEWCVLNLAITGNCFALIRRNSLGNVVDLMPFRNINAVGVNMDGEGNVYYTYATNDGRGVITFDRSDIFHVKLGSFTGLKGLSPIAMNKATVGASIAVDNQVSNFIENGCQLSGVISTEGTIPDEAFLRIKDEWKSVYSGSNNAGKTAILEYGLKYEPISLSPAEAQILEQRKYNKEEIAQIFRVPLSMLGDSSNKYASLEENSMNFMRVCLMPYITKIEAQLNAILPENHEIRLDETAFVRGDSRTLTDVVNVQITRGLISVNEGRNILGFEDVEGGDVFAVQTNNLVFGTWDQLGSVQEQLAANNPKPPTNSEDNKPDED